MNTEVAILSPEKTILTYRIASLGSRIGAQIIDVILLGAATVAITIAVTALAALLNNALIVGLTAPLQILSIFLYFILLEGLWNGQTLGKKLVGIRVRMADGTPITFHSAVGRNLLRIADLLPNLYFAGTVAMFMTPRSQRLGDLVARTIVVHDRRPIPAFAVAPHHVGVHPFEEYVGELRGMTDEEYQVLRRLCDRFPTLSAAVQARMLQEVWQPIAARRAVPVLANVHPLYLAEATVMKYGRQHGLL